MTPLEHPSALQAPRHSPLTLVWLAALAAWGCSADDTPAETDAASSSSGSSSTEATDDLVGDSTTGAAGSTTLDDSTTGGDSTTTGGDSTTAADDTSTGDAPPLELPSPEDFELIGEVVFASGTVTVEGTPLGGLSGLTYDPVTSEFHAICDDRSSLAPARFYTLTIDLSGDQLVDGGVEFTGVTTLLTEAGDPFGPGAIDPEGIALLSDGTLFVSSEGEANLGTMTLVAPWVRRFDLAGGHVDALPVDDRYTPTVDGMGMQSAGVRNNLAFESLTVAPGEGVLLTATENALAQDGPAATLGEGTRSRIVRYDLRTGQAVAEYLYVTDPIVAMPRPADGFATNGLVELVALDEDALLLLALERSFSVGVGNSVRLYAVDLRQADDVSGEASLADPTGIAAAEKTLLVDFGELGLSTVDNLEGLAFGPALSDGRRSLIVVGDDNFSMTQVTQIVALAVSGS